MARYRATIEVSRPPGEVFDYLSDLRNAVEWDRTITHVRKLSEGPPSQGTTYLLRGRFMGRDVELRYAATVLDRPQRLVFDGENDAARSVDRIAIEPAEDGARITYDAHLRMRGLLRLADPLVHLAFGRVGDRAVEGLRQRLGDQA